MFNCFYSWLTSSKIHHSKKELLEYMKQNPDDELVQQIMEQYELYINEDLIDNSIQEGEE